MTQEERQKRSKETIYQAALEEFGANGYDHVTMESICSRHRISKGMMYHYYSSRDELFLLCVERTFSDLKTYIEQNGDQLAEKPPLDAIRDFFLLREGYFQLHPQQKMIFETAMLHPPRHLGEEIRSLRAPIRSLNRHFISRLIKRMSLRPGLDPDKAARYLEEAQSFLQNSLKSYQEHGDETDISSMLETVEELLDMILFGVFQPENLSD